MPVSDITRRQCYGAPVSVTVATASPGYRDRLHPPLVDCLRNVLRTLLAWR